MGVLLDASELPTEEHLRIYRYYEYTCFVITVLIVIYTLIVITHKANNGINKYKWYLIHGILWGFCYDTMATLIGAVTLFPLPCYYGVNVSSLFSGKAQLVYFFIGIGASTGKILAVFLQFEYRYYQALRLDSWYRKNFGFLHGPLELHIRFFVIVLAITTVLTPMMLSVPDQDQQKAFLASIDPYLGVLFQQHPSAVCFSSGLDSSVAAMFLVWTVLAIIVCIIFAILTYRNIHEQKLTTNTYRLQLMLFKSLIAQMTAYFLLYMFPGIIYLISGIVKIRDMPKINVGVFYLFVTHTTVDSLMVLFFIRPYRKYVISNVRQVFKAVGMLSEPSRTSIDSMRVTLQKQRFLLNMDNVVVSSLVSSLLEEAWRSRLDNIFKTDRKVWWLTQEMVKKFHGIINLIDYDRKAPIPTDKEDLLIINTNIQPCKLHSHRTS